MYQKATINIISILDPVYMNILEKKYYYSPFTTMP